MGRFYNIIIALLCFTSVAFSASEKADDVETVYFNVSDVEARLDKTVPGQAMVAAGGRVFVLGGKTADGSLMSEVQILERAGDDFVSKRASLSEPVAYAGVFARGTSVYLVGGLRDAGVSSRVLKLEWDGESFEETELPALPEPCMLANVVIHRSTTQEYLYVLGGLTAQNGSLLAAMYELHLGALNNGTAAWVRKEDLPSGGRLGAVVCETYNEIVVSGGWTLDDDGKLEVSSQTWGYCRIARDGHAEGGWDHRADMPQPVALPAFAKTGQAHLTILGGDVSGGTLSQLLDGTKPVSLIRSVWAFHDPTDSWAELGALPQASVGGVFDPLSGETYFLVGAEDASGDGLSGLQFDFVRATRPMKMVDWAVIVVYFAIVAFIGVWFARKQNSAEEFALGNRNVKWWAAAISMFASGVSTISFMALPALVACIGLASTGPSIFLLVGVFLSAFLTYPLLRRLEITSTYEYLERRFGSVLRLTGSFIGIMTQLMGRIGIVVMLPALAISTMTGLDPWKAVLITGVLTTFYASAGGFEAVIWTDVTQGILMLVGFTAIGITTYLNVDGGFGAAVEMGRSLDRTNLFLIDFDVTTNMMWFAAVTQVIMVMAFASDQATAQRVLCTPMKDVRKLAFLGGTFSIANAYLVGFVGLGLFAFFKTHPDLLNPVMKNDQMVPLFILHRIPLGLSGLLIATLFAAAMSTVSTSVNSCAVMFGEDFYKRFRKNITSKHEMRVMQIVSLVSGFCGTGLALWLLSMPMPTLWETFTRIMALFGGGFIGVFALGMFTRRTHELGAIIGVFISAFVAFYIQYLPWVLHYGGLSVIIVSSCMVSGYLFSLIIPWKRKVLRGLTVWDMITDEEAQKRVG